MRTTRRGRVYRRPKRCSATEKSCKQTALALFSKLVGVEQDSDRAIVNQRHGHMRAELALLQRNSKRSKVSREMFDQRSCEIGMGGVGKARTSAVAAVGIERELRYQQYCCARIIVHQKLEHGTVHVTVFVLEDAEIRDLVRHPVSYGLAVGVGYAYEREETSADSTDCTPFDRNASRRDSLK